MNKNNYSYHVIMILIVAVFIVFGLVGTAFSQEAVNGQIEPEIQEIEVSEEELLVQQQEELESVVGDQIETEIQKFESIKEERPEKTAKEQQKTEISEFEKQKEVLHTQPPPPLHIQQQQPQQVQQQKNQQAVAPQVQPQRTVHSQNEDGGKGMSITILAPQATGLAENQSHLPALIQGEFISNFSVYSAIDVLDWQRREAIYVHILSSPSYSDSVQAQTAREIGNLIPTTHFMDGKLIKTPTGYNLQISIIRNSDKMIAASYSGNFTFWELNNLTGIRRASLELLPQMGVTLTVKAQQELAGAAEVNYVTAQTALARGVTAQRQGTEVAALSYYFQAAAFDPSMTEAVNRSSILNANITSGNIGDNVRNDIQWRRQWVERLKETEEFFYNFNKIESMPYTLFYTNDIKQGTINYQNETVAMSIETYLYNSGVWTVSIERALQAVYDGLNATGRKDTWQLGSWPQRGVTDLKAFEGRHSKFSVVFELLNNKNKVIGRQTLQSGGHWGLNWRGRPSVNISGGDRKTLHFQNVDANEITDKMTIRVASVNGKDAESAAIDGVLQIRAITANEVAENDRFRFAKGEIQGFANRRDKETTLFIPSTIWGDPVISIGDRAFKGIGLIGSLTIPNSVISIGQEAFWNNSAASPITIGANVAMAGNPFRHEHTYRSSDGSTHRVVSDNRGFYEHYNQNGKKAGIYTYYADAGWLSEAAAEERRTQTAKKEARPIRLGWNGTIGFGVTTKGSTSELFGKVYGEDNAIFMETGRGAGGFTADAGLTLTARAANSLALRVESNIGYLENTFWYGGSGYNFNPDIDKPRKNFAAKLKIFNVMLNVPVMLRFGKSEGGYIDAGYLFGFPIGTWASVTKGDKYPHDINLKNNVDMFSEYRTKQDNGIIVQLGGRGVSKESGFNFGGGLRFIYHLTKWDVDGTLKAPFVTGFYMTSDFF